MGTKPLILGRKLRYPITISNLIKNPGDTIKKGDTIFEYTFKWMKTVGDVVKEETWETEVTTTQSFPSSVDGKLVSWSIRKGQEITADMTAAMVEEDCSHSVQYAGLCAICGKDMKEASWASETLDADRAKINMIHDQTLLSVSQDEASKAEEATQRRLLKGRKLSLVVDLDQTIIHACIEPTIRQWQEDKNSPNYEAVKDVVKFQLSDDAPRGLASGCWYYIKQRPGLKEFLEHIAEKYELHVYTMGTRAYAQEIAKIVDPTKKLFGDRIISRDENGSLTAKSLSRLFPVDTKMVVIIDDRSDVWPRNRKNLIKVVPYDFFVGIGDINSSFLPKRREIARDTVLVPIKPKPDGKPAETELLQENKDRTVEVKVGTTAPTAVGSMAALEDLVAMGGGGDEHDRQVAAEEQAYLLEKQLVEKPLLHLQEQLEKEDSSMTDDSVNGTSVDSESTTSSEHHQKHSLLKDDDRELFYLEKHLLDLHRTFYEEYDNALVHARGGPVADLRPGPKRKIETREAPADLQLVPDIGLVMPRIKVSTLKGCHIVLSGLVPLGVDISRSELGIQAQSFGAILHTKVSKRITHLVVSANRTRTQKVRQAARYPGIKIVRSQWLNDCMSQWEKVDEKDYLISIHPADRSSNKEEDFDSEISRDTSGSDTEDNSGDETGTEDKEGVTPDDLDGGKSPIESLQNVDWGGVDDELADFLASGDDGDTSDDESVTSQSSELSTMSYRSQKRRPAKRGRESVEPSDTEGESSLSKKQRIARSRTTGLKTVSRAETNGEESEVAEENGAEEGNEDEKDDDGMGDLEAEMEAEMMKAFEEEDWEES